MTDTSPEPSSRIEALRLLAARAGYVLAGVLVVAGLVAVAAGRPAAARPLLAGAIGVLAVLPLSGVISLFAEEIRRRDWWFALVAGAVLLVLLDSLARAVMWLAG